MDLLHELVAIPSVTGSEEAVVEFLEKHFSSSGWIAQSIEVSPLRRNLFLHRGHPRVVLTTHADTVPPHFEPRREGSLLFGRGACDAKGSLAAMAVALEELASETEEVGLLVLVGEERGSDGALAANRHPVSGVQFLVGGEPTENRFATGSKGCLRVIVQTRGSAGHSSLPGSSAVLPLLDFLASLRSLGLPDHPIYGATTMNIGVLQAGVAPNVIAETARAEILFRTGLPVGKLLESIEALADGGIELEVPYRSDPISFRVPRATPSQVVSFACDLPLLTAWGEPLLMGPGSILDAHAPQEKVNLEQVGDAVSIYIELVRGLLSRGGDYLEPPGKTPSRIDEPMVR